MSDSKKLPTIEVGDTVIFRTDLEVGRYYDGFLWGSNMLRNLGQIRTVELVSDNGAFYVGNGFWCSPQMVNKVLVIKPSKARVYSEQDLKKAYEQGLEDGYHFDGSRADWEAEGLSSHLSDEYVNSLNTEGK